MKLWCFLGCLCVYNHTDQNIGCKNTYTDHYHHNHKNANAQNKTQAEVREAARQANALEFIDRFPEGFDTVVGEGGVALSGGQRYVCGWWVVCIPLVWRSVTID